MPLAKPPSSASKTQVWFARDWNRVFSFILRKNGFLPWITNGTNQSFSIPVLVSGILYGTLMSIGTIAVVDVFIKTLANVPSNTEKTTVIMVAALFIQFAVAGILLLILFPILTRPLNGYIEELRQLLAYCEIPLKQRRRLFVAMAFQLLTFAVSCVTTFYIHATQIFSSDTVYFLWYPVNVQIYVAVFQMFPLLTAGSGQSAFTYPFVYIAAVIAFAFRENNKLVARAIRGMKNGEVKDQTFLRELALSRMNHWKLSEMVDKLDGVFAPLLLFQTGFDVMALTFLIGIAMGGRLEVPLGVFATSNAQDLVFLTICALANFILFFSRMVVASYMKNQAHAILPLYHRCTETILDENNKIRDIISATIQRLRDSPVGFTAWKLVVLDTGFILTVFGLLLTYLIVIYEMTSRNRPQNDINTRVFECNCSASRFVNLTS